MTQVEALERAILAQAERLANEFRDRAKRSSDSILRESAEKLRLREQREDAIAKALGERTFRQQVQAEELKMQGLLDRTRWDLVTRVEKQLVGDMQALIAQDYVNGYLFQLPKTGVANADIEGLWENSPTQANDMTGVSWAE